MIGSDVYSGLSFDELHTLWLGLWSKHLFTLVKDVIKDQNFATPGLDILDQRYVPLISLNRRVLIKINFSIKLIPRFPGLRHFDHISGELFPDGKQALAILQVSICDSHM